MLIRKKGISNIVFLVKNSILPKDDQSSANMLRFLAEEAFKESGINIRGSIELETFSSYDETIVFAHDIGQNELFKFDSAENMMDAALQLLHLDNNINASLLFCNGKYYILINDYKSTIKSLMSEYNGKLISNNEMIEDIINSGKILTDISMLHKIYFTEKHHG